MDCPKCGAGKIRVVTPIACSCGHHPLVCDACTQHFAVPCGDLYEAPGLPPEVPIHEDDRLRQGYDHLVATLGDKKAQSFEKMTRDTIAREPEHFPTVEEFKASLAT
jgi:transposase-like protein